MPKNQTPFEEMARLLADWETANPTPLDIPARVSHDKLRRSFLRSHGWSARNNRTNFFFRKAQEAEDECQREHDAWALSAAMEAGFSTIEAYVDHIVSNLKDSP